AEAARVKDELQAKSAQADADRYAALLRDKVVSEQQNLQYKTTADAMNQTVRADQAAIEAARASLDVDQAAGGRAKVGVGYCEIHAPISGRVGNLLVHPGNLVKVNDVALVVINRIEPVFVNFNAPEKYLETIRRFNAERRLPVQILAREGNTAKANG